MNDKDIQLLRAAREDRADEVRTLLRDGANIEAKDGGWSALHKAAWNGHAEVVQILLDAGADIEAKDSDDWSALHQAAWNGRADVVRVLLEDGADIQATSGSGWTALHHAARRGHTDIVRILLDSGADPEAKNNYDETARDMAERYNEPNVVEFLDAWTHPIRTEPAEAERQAARRPRILLNNIMDDCEKDPALLEALRPELERIRSLLMAQTSPYPADRMIVVLEGGMVAQVLRPDLLVAGPVNVAIVDYDTDGADPDELVSIPQQDHPKKEFADARAHIEPVARCAPSRFDEIWRAVENGPAPAEDDSASPS